jgi:signal transduction histidine kinase
VAALEAVFFVWVWLFRDKSRFGDFATALLIFLTVFGALLNTFILAGASGDFNSGWSSTVWEAFGLIVLSLGAVGLIVRRPMDWNVGWVMLTLLSLGHLLQILVPGEGQLAGWVRLSELAAFPLLLLLPFRRSQADQLTPINNEDFSEGLTPTRERYRIDPKTLENILKLSTETEISELCVTIARAISHAMLADVCFLLSPPNREGDISLQCGYDLILESQLSGGILSATQLPMVASAIAQRKAVRLPVTSTSEDLSALTRALGLQKSGHLLVVPINFPDKEPIAAIGLFSPYSNRDWGPDEENFLVRISAVLAAVIDRTYNNQGHAEKLQEVQSAMEQFREQAALATAEKVDLENLIDSLKAEKARADEVVEPQADQEDLQRPELLERQKEAARVIRQLQQENDRLRLAANASTQVAAVSVPNGGEPTKEQSELHKSLDHALARLEALEQVAVLHEQDVERWQLILSILRDLDTPMSHIRGYADFLLEESAGALGPLQKRYLSQVNDALSRIRSYSADLAQIASLQTGTSPPNGAEISVSDVIDRVIGELQRQIRMNDQALHVDLPEDLPVMQGDRDLLELMLTNVLTNALETSPEGGEISLWAAYRSFDDGMDFIELGVEDSGGGVPAEKLAQIFMRTEPEADRVPGLGPSQNSLAVARILVESHNGRIWAEAIQEKGTSIHVLLPLNQRARAAAEETWDGS